MVSPWATLIAQCASAKRVIIAAPYIKAPVLQDLLNCLDNNANIECFTRWTPQDILAGTTDTACRNLVVAKGGKFYLHNRLHAKYYRFDVQVLIGSANCTAPGLNYNQRGNLEILCRPDQSFNKDQFEKLLRAEAREVSEEELALWLACPVNTPIAETVQGDFVANTLEDWKPLTRFPEYLWLIYNNQENEAPDSAQRARARADLQVLKPAPELSREEFNRWTKTCLVAAPFVDSVVKLEKASQEHAWLVLSNEWGLETSAAERARSTVQNWTRHFGLT